MRVYTWGAPPADASATDATIELELESPEGEPHSAFLHTRIARRDARWVLPSLDDATEAIRRYLEEHQWESDSNLADARWLVQPPPVDTAAKRWPGAAQPTITRELGVVFEDWMQDWPLEASDGAQLEPAMAFYDRTTDRDVRFDTMALALFCFDERTRQGTAGDAAQWFEARLVANIAELGHLVAYWALLHARPLVPDESFAISPLVRRIFWDALVEVAAEELEHAAPRS